MREQPPGVFPEIRTFDDARNGPPPLLQGRDRQGLVPAATGKGKAKL